MYNEDLTSNNLQWLMCHKTQPNPTKCDSLTSRHKISQDVLILFTNPSAWAGYNTRSIFKQGLTGLNSEFSFS